MEILRLDGLCKQYPAFRLDNVSFSMEAGTIMGLIGRNGAGKTTLLRCMAGLEKLGLIESRYEYTAAGTR